MINIIKYTLITTTSLIGIFMVFALLITFINKKINTYLYCVFGNKSITITGLIGVPVHEISHYILAKLFNHKVSDIKLYRPIQSKNDGVLGYVNHSYNKNSLYQNVGNFFIGIAPIIIGPLVITFSFRVLMPNLWSNIIGSININSYNTLIENFNIINLINLYISDFYKTVMIILLSNPFVTIRFWIFVFIAFSISINMNLSRNDLKGSYSGLITLFLGMLILNTIFIIFGFDYNILKIFIIKWNIIIGFFLSFIILFSLSSLFILSILYNLKRS